MQFSPLSAVKHRVSVGVPLPFNVRNADGTLLLARSQVIDSAEQMQALFDRGTLVDLSELRVPATAIRMAPREALPGLWRQTLDEVAGALVNAGADGFLPALEAAAPQVSDLVARDPDLAIFQILQEDAGRHARYGANLAMRSAIVCQLVARRLGWSDHDAQRVMKAALTMNISMFELQGQLAEQAEPLSEEQRAAIHAHPEFSVRMLELSGVADKDWLRAVAHHHAMEGSGSGYPKVDSAISDMAQLMHRADIYTAKLSSRQSRDAMAADTAARTMFMSEPGHPMVAALIKEFGAYPPGCFVRLASGETAVVVRRGPTVVTPVVAVLVDAAGRTLAEPLRRDTSQTRYAVTAVVDAKQARAQVDQKKLVLLT
jgi:HD-GYP domain-containing protein (c-di-GMP phosphodiesterase class II)